ncbi:aminoglycoside phosphotransferase [Bifidobacterium goeldii]|uniref:Aminoglycoside phosphotransferase n=1 Tax=Bifidobacterium goeldii TaxID=2306975 RepID=A0A430FNE5_9BIFI|nr:phosphotransferase [Bifidobacterium goeldii]RSX54347.1 aminoglycoside phosphotransferase [Bifidobacterium goeldii]
MLAALTSAIMPGIVVAGVRASDQGNDTDAAVGIDQAVVQDAAGRQYDVYACDSDEGRKRLQGRVRAAQTLKRAKDPAALGFALDNVLAFADGKGENSVTGGTAVMAATHRAGTARPLTLLTLDDCASVGTAIGAIHRLRPNFLQAESYPVFTTGQIRAQLTAWIKRLQQAGHVPAEITASWSSIIETEGLWSFLTCPVHGGFSDGDFLFEGSTITAITNWQDMQVNDPARDLAWIFAKLDNDHRNAVLAAYGRMMGSRLDDLIMLRANLWLQMEQVGDFISALNRADSQKIMQFKAQVERLAHQLGRFTQQQRTTTTTASAASSRNPSTITVGTLLDAEERRQAAAQSRADRAADRAADPNDETDETDRTGSADIQAAGTVSATQPSAAPVTRAHTAYNAASTWTNQEASSSETIVVHRVATSASSSTDADDKTDDHAPVAAASSTATPSVATPSTAASSTTTPSVWNMAAAAPASYPAARSPFASAKPQQSQSQEAPTIAIPLLEREERAMRDAQSSLIPSASAKHTSETVTVAQTPITTADSAEDDDDTGDAAVTVSVETDDTDSHDIVQTAGTNDDLDDDTNDNTPKA